jgi:hypothetical protein
LPVCPIAGQCHTLVPYCRGMGASPVEAVRTSTVSHVAQGLMTRPTNPSWTSRVAHVSPYDPVASITIRPWEAHARWPGVGAQAWYSPRASGPSQTTDWRGPQSAGWRPLPEPPRDQRPRKAPMTVLSGLSAWPSLRSTPLTQSRYASGTRLLQAVRAAQLVMRGQGHRKRSSLLTTVGRGGHASLRGPSRRCHLVLTTTRSPTDDPGDAVSNYTSCHTRPY